MFLKNLLYIYILLPQLTVPNRTYILVSIPDPAVTPL